VQCTACVKLVTKACHQAGGKGQPQPRALFMGSRKVARDEISSEAITQACSCWSMNCDEQERGAESTWTVKRKGPGQ
jgi:hypothetical protein